MRTTLPNSVAPRATSNLVSESSQNNPKRETTCSRVTRILTLKKDEEEAQLVTMGLEFCKSLDNLEREPVLFVEDKKVIEQQQTTFKAYLKQAKEIKNTLAQSYSNEVSLILKSIDKRIVGLKYRIEAKHGGLERETVDENLLKKLVEVAQVWKEQQELYPRKDKALSPRDLDKMKQACQFPEFVRILFKDKALQKIFFNWTIRDNNGVPQFIEFPATCERMHATHIDKRVGYLNPNELASIKRKISFSKPVTWEKVICLPFFDGQKVWRISILDESRSIVLNGNWLLSIKEIFDIFAEKDIAPGNVEYFGPTGITNWADHEFGTWDPKTKSYARINLETPEWWQQLPLFQVLSKTEVENKYHLLLTEGDWLHCIKANRCTLAFEVKDRHGYVEFAIPLKDGNYGIYPFGKFTSVNPTQFLEQIKLLWSTVKGKIAYIDQNVIASYRQHAIHPETRNRENGIRMLEKVRKDVVKSINENLTFQFGGENCSEWAGSVGEDKGSDNPYKMPLTKMQPSDFVINTFLSLPTSLQPYAMKCLRFFSKRNGMSVIEEDKPVYKSTAFAQNFNEQIQYQPGRLHQHIEEGTLSGSIFYGHYT